MEDDLSLGVEFVTVAKYAFLFLFGNCELPGPLPKVEAD